MAYRVYRHRSPANVQNVAGAERRPLTHVDGTPIDFASLEEARAEAARLNGLNTLPNVWFTAE